MEVISRYVPKSLLYTAIYLITLFTSLSSTTTPAVEPFLLSLFGAHSYISSIAIVTSIAFAVCKPPMAKILDVFGRAEGLAVSAILYGIGGWYLFLQIIPCS
jgi:MFS family permease